MLLDLAAGYWFEPEFLGAVDPVLDVGAGNGEFAHEMIRRGHFSVCLEPNPTQTVNRQDGMAILNRALVGPHEPLAKKFIVNGEEVWIPASDIVTLSRQFGIQQWGIVKLNCKSSEQDILENWPGPIAKQITLMERPSLDYAYIERHLKQWYRREEMPHGRLYVMAT